MMRYPHLMLVLLGLSSFSLPAMFQKTLQEQSTRG